MNITVKEQALQEITKDCTAFLKCSKNLRCDKSLFLIAVGKALDEFAKIDSIYEDYKDDKNSQKEALEMLEKTADALKIILTKIWEFAGDNLKQDPEILKIFSSLELDKGNTNVL